MNIDGSDFPSMLQVKNPTLYPFADLCFFILDSSGECSDNCLFQKLNRFQENRTAHLALCL